METKRIDLAATGRWANSRGETELSIAFERERERRPES
jgi:hypothetical protein